MINHLDKIILQKKKEVADLKSMLANNPGHIIHRILQTEKRNAQRLKTSLSQSQLAIIAEIKRKSPSMGLLARIDDPLILAQSYIAGGASAISVLTDETFFGGHLNDLERIAQQFPQHPMLRKDFIIDELQIAQASAAGADAILCIVAVVQEKLASLLASAKKIGIEVVVEVNNKNELEYALTQDVEIIAVNNRNLKTMDIDATTSLQLINYIPDSITKIAASGIVTPAAAKDYYQAGYNAVLIGQALVTTDNPQQFIQECRL